MHKQQAIQISIPEPCHQSWDAMTPSQDGRFCNECSKTVIDFSGWSDAALYQFFAKNNITVCGRFLSTQLDVPIRIPHQPHSRLYRITIALGLILICTQTPALLAQNRPPKVAQGSGITDTIQTLKNTSVELASICGKVVDGKNEALINATIQVYQAGVLMGGNLTDYDGNYVVQPLKPGLYDMLITFTGYDSVTIKGIVVNAGDSTVQNVVLARNHSYNYKSGIVAIIPYTFHTQLHGSIKDRHKKPLPYATVRIYKNDILYDSEQADEKGKYSLRLPIGIYELRVFYADYDSVVLSNLELKRNKKTKQNINMGNKPKTRTTITGTTDNYIIDPKPFQQQMEELDTFPKAK